MQTTMLEVPTAMTTLTPATISACCLHNATTMTTATTMLEAPTTMTTLTTATTSAR